MDGLEHDSMLNMYADNEIANMTMIGKFSVYLAHHLA